MLDPNAEQVIDKVSRFLDTAANALENGDSESAASRAYYALYHITVLLLRVVRGIERDRWDHDQLQRAFLDHFCKLGYMFSRQDGHDWTYVKDSRIVADYGRTPLPLIRGRRTLDRARKLADGMAERIKGHDQAR